MITVARFSMPYEAHIAKSRLESEGIPAFVADEHTVGMNWLYSNAMGGVRLQVPSSHKEEALRILSEDMSDVASTEDLPPSVQCPSCGGSNVEYVSVGRKPAFLTWLILSFPLWKVSKEDRCMDCGERFHCET